MDYLTALIYGIIQGLCEFLPISSSGHLALLPLMLKIEDPGVFFDLMMHLGTTFSILIYFRKTLASIFKSAWNHYIQKRPSNTSEKSEVAIFTNIAIATIVSVLAILVLKPFSEIYARNHLLIAFNLIVFGILLYLADWRSKRNGTHEAKEHDHEALARINMTFATLVGLAQAIAIFPGVSRSGITLTAVLLFGCSRKSSAHFIFLLSIPVIVIGSLKAIFDVIKTPGTQESVPYGPLLFGLFVSFLIGLLAIHYFLKWFRSFGIAPFTIYRIGLGVVILYLGDFLLK
jgi:undecaprenyl-diphosphatase